MKMRRMFLLLAILALAPLTGAFSATGVHEDPLYSRDSPHASTAMVRGV